MILLMTLVLILPSKGSEKMFQQPSGQNRPQDQESFQAAIEENT